jgi:paraquat-inducible protein B
MKMYIRPVFYIDPYQPIVHKLVQFWKINGIEIEIKMKKKTVVTK